jgi:hypothetical protein
MTFCHVMRLFPLLVRLPPPPSLSRSLQEHQTQMDGIVNGLQFETRNKHNIIPQVPKTLN